METTLSDIVEALQFLKCTFRNELVFREYLSSAVAEGVQEATDGEGVPSWDESVDLDSGDDSDNV